MINFLRACLKRADVQDKKGAARVRAYLHIPTKIGRDQLEEVREMYQFTTTIVRHVRFQ